MAESRAGHGWNMTYVGRTERKSGCLHPYWISKQASHPWLAMMALDCADSSCEGGADDSGALSCCDAALAPPVV